MSDEEQSNQNAGDNAGDAHEAAPKKCRGRPPKVAAVAAATMDAPAAPKRRGRPPKAATTAVTSPAEPKRRGRPPKTVTAVAESVPARRVVVKQGVSVDVPAKRRGRPRKVVPEAEPRLARGSAPSRRIVLKQGLTVAQYRKALSEAEAGLVAVKVAKASAKADTRLACSAEPGYAPPKRRIVVRDGAMADYLASLEAPVIEVLEVAVQAPGLAQVSGEQEEQVPATRLLRRKRVEGEPRAFVLGDLARRIDGDVSAFTIPDVIPELVYEGEPPPPSKRPGRRPAVVVKKRRAKGSRVIGGLRRGRKPRKAGVLSAGARRRTVAPE